MSGHGGHEQGALASITDTAGSAIETFKNSDSSSIIFGWIMMLFLLGVFAPFGEDIAQSKSIQAVEGGGGH